MKRKIEDIVFGRTYGDVAVQYALGEALTDLVAQRINPDTVHTEEVDIVLTIDGVEYNHEEFFEMLSESYFKHVRNEVKKIMVEKTLDALSELETSIYDMKNHLDDLSNKIDYLEIYKNEKK